MWRLVTLALTWVMLAGCGSDTPSPRGPLQLTAANEASLLAIGRRFDALVATLPPAQARAEAITRAQDDANVRQATLGEDGVSIAIVFRDGAFAFLVTEPPGSGTPAGVGRARGAWDWRWFAREMTILAECPDLLVPASKRVKIIDAAFDTHPAVYEYEQQIVEELDALGWDTEVDIDNPLAPTLSDLTDLGGYGMVIYIGGGGTLPAPDGESHHYLQGLAEQPSSTESWEDVVGPEEQARWQALLEEGKLAHGYVKDADGDWAPSLYLQDDFIAEALAIDAPTTVICVSPNGNALADEMAEAGVTNYFTFEGSPSFEHATDATLGLLEAMAFEGVDASTAYEMLAATDPGSVSWPDGTRLVDASTGPGAVMPTWFDDGWVDYYAPDETATVEVRLDHLDCPDSSFSATRNDDENLIVNGLAPGDCVVTVVYRNAEGEVIGYATTEYRLEGGANTPSPQPCEVTVDFVWSAVPPGVSVFDVSLTWHDPFLEDQEVTYRRAPIDTAIRGASGFPGPGTLWFGGFPGTGSGDDDWLGVNAKLVDLACGPNTFDLCLGWGVVSPPALPPGATSANLLARQEVSESSVVLDPSAPTLVEGVWTDYLYTYSAAAFDAQNNVLGFSAVDSVTFGCGPNSMDLCFGWLELAPPEVPPGTTSVIAETSAELAPGPLGLALDAMTPMTGFSVGETITLTTTARDAGGALVGASTRELTIGCNANVVEPCFAWARFEVGAVPPGTAEVRVWREDEDDAVVVPVGGSALMVGFDAAPADVQLMAEAFDGDGDAIARASFTARLDACGENLVTVAIVDYGIVLEVVPTRILADGVDAAVVTATLRAYAPDDGPTPTGAPVAGKTVEFATDLGALTGPNPVITGADGAARVELTSTTEGKATVRAFVAADDKEAVRLVRVGSGGYFEDFEALVGTEWSHLTTMASAGTTWLGPFWHEEVDLTLVDLPQHNRVLLGFDLLVLGFWQGDGCTIYDHAWYAEDGTYMGEVDVAVGTPQFVVLYSAPGSSTPSYNALRTNEVYNEKTLCDVERSPLDERTGVIGAEASTYHFELEIDHTDYGETDPLILRFWEDERIIETLEWYGIQVTTPRFAIDNVSVDVCMVGSTCP